MKIGHRGFKGASCRVVVAEGLPEDMRSGTREIVSVTSSNPRKGHANGLMWQVCVEADVDGIVLILMPKPFGDSTMTAEQLEKWYGRFGFVTIQTEPEKLMARQPSVRAARLAVAR
jgi:hypothetical protein